MLDPRLAGLLNPAAYEPRPSTVELRETHISWVLLAGDRAFKVKKPVRLPFLDYGSQARRRELCHAEVALNARLAPRIYLGVCAIVPAGDGVRLADESDPAAIEYAVVMRRYDEAATLARRAPGPSTLRAVGRRIAAFHAAAAIPPAPEHAVPALEVMLAENFATLRALDVDVDDTAALATAFLRGRRGQLVERSRRGRVREGHGDLRAEHVLLEHGIEIVDCVEFDPALRRIDVGFDLAFLWMDVLSRGRELADALAEGYRAGGGDPGDDGLLGFFAAQRALIRAKVALIRAGQVGPDDAPRRRADAAALLELAARLSWQVRLGRLAVVCGPAASGKSTLARALATRSGASVLSSDVVRKRLLGIAPTARAPRTAYDVATNRRTYETLGREAARRLAGGEHVLVDATFRFTPDREAFARALGDRTPLWLVCRAPADVVAQRAAARARGAGTSDADAQVAARSVAEFHPIADGIVVDTTGRLEATLRTARRMLDARLGGSGRDVDELMLERVPDELGA